MAHSPNVFSVWVNLFRYIYYNIKAQFLKLAWLIFKVLIAIYNGRACQIGQPTDFYAWMDAHPNYVVARVFETPTRGDYWLVEDQGNYELIAFWDDISDNLYNTSIFHVKCFRKVGS